MKTYYRFEIGHFIKAKSFEEAKANYIKQIQDEVEDKDSWHSCTCLGLSHRYDCPEHEIPY
jgi:hypothetical protein